MSVESSAGTPAAADPPVARAVPGRAGAGPVGVPGGSAKAAGATGGWWLVAGAGVLTQFLTMVNGVVTARMLGVAGRGDLVLVVILSTAASQLSLGGSLPNAITHQLADRSVTARDGLRGMVGRWSLWGCAAGAAGGAYLLLVHRAHLDVQTWLLAACVLVMAVQAMASKILVGAMMGEGTPLSRVAVTGLLPQLVVVLVVGTALLAGVHWSVVEVLAVTIGCTGLVLATRLRVLRPASGRGEDRLDRAALGRLARRTHIGSVGPIDGLGIDRILVGSLAGSMALGLYSAAFALGGLTNIFGVVLAMVALPRVTRAQHDPTDERRFVRGWVLLSVAVMALIVVAVEVVMAPLIHYTFGADFLPAVPIGRWLVIGSGMLGLRRVFIAVLQGRGRGGTASVVELALTPVMVVGIVVSAQLDSVVGLGVTMAVVGSASCLALALLAHRSDPAPVEV